MGLKQPSGFAGKHFADGAARIARDYEAHCRAARKIAEEYFDSDQLICRLAAEVGLDLK